MKNKEKEQVVGKEDTKRILQLIKGDDSELRIEIPKTARVTFGPSVPYTPKNGFGQHQGSGYSLRVYEDTTQNSLVAVFSNIVSFRDLTIPCFKAIVKESGQTLWKSDEEGYQVETKVKKETSLVDASRLLRG